MADFTLRREVIINTPVAKVWEVITNPVSIKKFYFGMDWHTNWQKGSPIKISGTWDREYFEDKANIIDIEKEKFILFNIWHSNSDTLDKPENYTKIRYEIKSYKNGTLFTIFQYGFKNEAATKPVVGKWENILSGIKKIAEKVPGSRDEDED